MLASNVSLKRNSVLNTAHGIETRLIARGNGDDALFELLDGMAVYAVVHLTWARHPEPLPWPATELYNSLTSFVNERMIPEHSGFES